MEVQPDFRDLLKLFNAHKVEYVVIGGYALAFHGAPRYTGDLDIFVKPDPENAQRIMKALGAFGFGSLELTAEDFQSPDRVIQLGVPPVRIDIVTSVTNITWETAAANRIEGKYGDVVAFYMGRAEFVANKRAVGRKKDLADLEALGEE